MSRDKKPIALYIHIPWCIEKCPYCDFNSHRLSDSPEFSRYIDALISELKQQIFLFAPLKEASISTIFIGGGTPSLCPAEALNRLLEFIFANFQCVENMEITIEANPGTAESQYFADYVQAGVNRISIGAQSFDDAMLKRLGRIHCADENYRALDYAHKAGFKRINLDLMYALPTQSVAMALRDLQAALSCHTEHLSYYQLTLEENTPFYRRPPMGMPNEGLSWAIFQQAEVILEQYGFSAYEVSAWSNSLAAQCQHNVNYWCFGDYIGIGAGAHGKISTDSREEGGRQVWRTQNINSPMSYMQEIEAESLPSSPGLKRVYEKKQYVNGMRVTEVRDDEILFEYMLNRLRLYTPFSLEECAFKTGLRASCIEDKLLLPLAKGLLEKIENRDEDTPTLYQKTPLGCDFLNDLIWEFH